MSDQPPGQPSPPAEPQPQRPRILGDTSVLPAVVTLMNGIAGFAAIHYATKGGLGSAELGNLTLSAWLILAAILFDALDGRLARLTRRATDFGAQLDSLCDVISFGVAPAVLMVHTVFMAIGGFDVLRPHAPLLGKGVMAIGALYACCAVIRLARFNMENAPSVLRHMYFKGLPSPGAAATVAAMVLLFAFLQGEVGGWKRADWLKIAVGTALPAVTLTCSALMISRFPYPHLLNQFVLGKRPFGHIVKALVVIVAGLIFPQMVLALGTLVYSASGPAGAAWRRFRPAKPPPAA